MVGGIVAPTTGHLSQANYRSPAAHTAGGILADRSQDRRESPRLNLALNVAFLTEGQERQATRMGTTANVSAGGVYFSTSEWQGLRPGQEVGLRLSGLSGYGAGPLFRDLRVRADILRVDPPAEQTGPYAKGGVAARFTERPCFEVYRWSE